MRNVSEKSVEKIRKHCMFSNLFSENRTVYEIKWQNIVERGKPQMTIWLMRIACWISTTTNKHSEYAMIYLTAIG